MSAEGYAIAAAIALALSWLVYQHTRTFTWRDQHKLKGWVLRQRVLFLTLLLIGLWLAGHAVVQVVVR